MDPLLNESIIQQLKEVFKEMLYPVEVLFFASQHNPEVSEYSRQLLSEVAAVSDQVILSMHDLEVDAELAAQFHVDKAPGFAILGRGQDGQRIDYGVRFAGFPGNFEFTSFINGLMLVSRRESGLKPETKTALASLKEPLHLMVFVTPT